jgi:hypothetical protein
LLLLPPLPPPVVLLLLLVRVVPGEGEGGGALVVVVVIVEEGAVAAEKDEEPAVVVEEDRVAATGREPEETMRTRPAKSTRRSSWFFGRVRARPIRGRRWAAPRGLRVSFFYGTRTREKRKLYLTEFCESSIDAVELVGGDGRSGFRRGEEGLPPDGMDVPLVAGVVVGNVDKGFEGGGPLVKVV